MLVDAVTKLKVVSVFLHSNKANAEILWAMFLIIRSFIYAFMYYT